MAVKSRLGLSQQTRLALTPAVRQSLRLLRMPAADLAEVLAAAAADNPFLVLSRPARGVAGRERAMAMVAVRPGLIESLQHQLRLSHLEPDLCRLAERIAGELREDGYLDGTVAELAAEFGVPETQVEAALAAVQVCEPAGVGARTLAECLELQLVEAGLGRDLARRAVGQIADLAEGRLGRAAQALGVARDEAARIAKLLRGLSPRPVEPDDDAPATLAPDIEVLAAADGTFAVVPARAAPGVRLDRRLAGQARADAAFANGRIDEARALIRAMEQREATLLALGRALVERQAGFFAAGPDRLVPLSRADLAAATGLHPATVGRAVAGKGLLFCGRVWPLAAFFSAALPGTQGEARSSAVVRRAIARMVAAEAPSRPLSDARIRERLAADGVDISRRTVAKYREGMRIPPSHERRRRVARTGAGRAGAEGDR